MKKLYSPNNEAELAIIKSLLIGEGVYFFVHNDHFGTLRIGPRIPLFNEKTIMVSEDQLERARELILDYLNNIKPETYISEYTIKDKVRVIFEALIFGWFIPGKRWPEMHEEDKKGLNQFG